MSHIDAKFRPVLSLLTYLVRALFECEGLKELIVAPGKELDGISDSLRTVIDSITWKSRSSFSDLELVRIK